MSEPTEAQWLEGNYPEAQREDEHYQQCMRKPPADAVCSACDTELTTYRIIPIPKIGRIEGGELVCEACYDLFGSI